MKHNPDKTTALYYRTAHSSIEQRHLDNQMNKLLCYAEQNGISDYVLYTDAGTNGIMLVRHAMLEMLLAVQAGLIERIIVADLNRISRNAADVLDFLRYTAKYGVSVIALDNGTEVLEIVAALYYDTMKGGK